MKAAQDRQKSYADKRRRDLKFSIGDLVFVKISPLKKVIRHGRRGKLAPRFVGPFPVLKQVGNLADYLTRWRERTTYFLFPS